MQPAHIADRPDKLTPRWTSEAYREILGRVAAAEATDNPEAWLQLFADWNALKSYVEGEDGRLYFAFSRDMGDPAKVEAERSGREEVRPVGQKGDAEMVTALLASQHKGAIAQRYGEHLIRVMEVHQAPLASVNADLRVREGKLANQYDQLIAQGKVTVRGERCTLARAHGMTRSEDGALRRESFEAYQGWFAEHRDELATLFDELVKVRDQMGRNLGHANYVPLGYAVMRRTDYGTEEAARFRKAVRDHVSPLMKRMSNEQARALGTPTLKAWDSSYHPHLNLPAKVAEPVGEQLDKMARALDRLSPRLAAHLERLRAEGRIDIEERAGKIAGAYCVDFHDEPSVAVLCNSTGGEEDIVDLAHELGHAFQVIESQWIEAVDLRSPTQDASEIHSMGMEFLCLPYLDEFFSAEDLRTFSRNRWRRSVKEVSWGTLGDAFQHWVYENPSASMDEREAEFARLHSIYIPGIDWSGGAKPYVSTMWYSVEHFFRYPFYSIDYALAETAAMQLGMQDAQDHDACMETYMELCRLGGTAGLTQLLESAGLRSPFEPELLEDLMAYATAQFQ